MVSRLRRWTEAKVIETIARAAAAGHDVNDLVRRPSAPGQQQGVYAVCSCGWESSPRKATAAAMAGLWHALEVCQVLDQRKQLDGVEWSAAPASKALRTYMGGVSLDASPNDAA